jgi:hypothetical protein
VSPQLNSSNYSAGALTDEPPLANPTWSDHLRGGTVSIKDEVSCCTYPYRQHFSVRYRQHTASASSKLLYWACPQWVLHTRVRHDEKRVV